VGLHKETRHRGAKVANPEQGVELAVPGAALWELLLDWGTLMPGIPDLTRLLQAWSRGDDAALDTLVRQIFGDLRRIARGFLRGGAAETLQTGDLVNEFFPKLLGQQRVEWKNREQFFAVSKMLMRRIFLDYVKAKRAAKRGGGLSEAPLDEALGLGRERDADVDALYEALDRLEELDPRQARIVELRYFYGFTFEEIAEGLGVGLKKVRSDWQTARLWLYQFLKPE
jgi:RNA polymerase sigma-70 factor, ECF subfamily